MSMGRTKRTVRVACMSRKPIHPDNAGLTSPDQEDGQHRTKSHGTLYSAYVSQLRASKPPLPSASLPSAASALLPTKPCFAPTHPIPLHPPIHPSPTLPHKTNLSLPPVSPTSPVRREEKNHNKKRKRHPHKTPSDEAEDMKYLKKDKSGRFSQAVSAADAQSTRTTNASVSQRSSLPALLLCCCGAVFAFLLLLLLLLLLLFLPSSAAAA